MASANWEALVLPSKGLTLMMVVLMVRQGGHLQLPASRGPSAAVQILGSGFWGNLEAVIMLLLLTEGKAGPAGCFLAWPGCTPRLRTILTLGCEEVTNRSLSS